MRGPSFAGVILFVLGGVLMVTSYEEGRNSWRLREHGSAATGTILEMAISVNPNRPNDVSYFPVFSYRGVAGKTMTVRSSISAQHSAFRVGEQVPVLYDRDDPALARIDTFGQMWWLPAIFAVTGPAIWVLGIWVWWRRRKGR